MDTYVSCISEYNFSFARKGKENNPKEREEIGFLEQFKIFCIVKLSYK